MVHEQASTMAMLSSELEHTLDYLHFVSKDVKGVVTAMEKGEVNTEVNMKKLTYRATDVDNVVKTQREWKSVLENSIAKANKCLKDVGED